MSSLSFLGSFWLFFKSTLFNCYFLFWNPLLCFLFALVFLPNLPFPKFSFNSYKLAVYCHLHCRRQFPTGFIYNKFWWNYYQSAPFIKRYQLLVNSMNLNINDAKFFEIFLGVGYLKRNYFSNFLWTKPRIIPILTGKRVGFWSNNQTPQLY